MGEDIEEGKNLDGFREVVGMGEGDCEECLVESEEEGIGEEDEGAWGVKTREGEELIGSKVVELDGRC